MTTKTAFDLIRKHKIEIVDFKFIDLPGLWHHFSVPASELAGANIFEEWIGFDGSSIRGFQEIHESDMLLRPDPSTAVVDPVCSIPTLSLICDVFDSMSRKPYSRDPRHVARKAEEYLKKSGIADTSFWGPELEFFVFDGIRYDSQVNQAFYRIDSAEGEWTTGREESPNLGYKLRHKEGYFPVPPHDTLQDIRSEMALTLIRSGVPVELHHHEVASAGQTEIGMRYDTLVRKADEVMLYKYIVKNVARKYNKVATFMPKPLFGDNGSGMHIHQSLWKGGKPLFYDAKGYALISTMCKHYIAGLLKHAHALMALCAPSTNSYKRLVPGYEAPVNLVYSQRNRSAAIRIPTYSTSPKARRIEFRPPDPTCNPYLAFAALQMAGLDGIRHKMDPGRPVDKNIYELPPSEARSIPTVPGSLEQALNALEKDHDFLLEGGVFTEDVIETWLSYKRKHEVDPVRLRPHPYEFRLYFDA